MKVKRLADDSQAYVKDLRDDNVCSNFTKQGSITEYCYRDSWGRREIGSWGGVLPTMAYTGRLHPKGVPFSGFRYIKG